MFWLDTNNASPCQCNSLCFKGDSPSTKTLQALLGSAGGCPEHMEEGPARTIFLRKQPPTSHLYQKPPLLSTSRVSAVPSELHSGPKNPVLGATWIDCHSSWRFCYKFYYSSKSRIYMFKFSSSRQTFLCTCFAMGKDSSLPK